MLRLTRPIIFGFLVSIVLAVAATAVSASDGDVRIDDVWARPTPPGVVNGAVYFTLSSDSASDRLLGASSPAAERAGFHMTMEKDGMLSMEHVEAVAVEPGATVRFAPGGYHVMLMGLQGPLREGDRFPLTLSFEEAGDLEVDVLVRSKAEDMPHSPNGGGHQH